MKAIKLILRSFVFLFGLVVILMQLQPIFEPKNNSQDSGIEDVSANGILSERKNSIDVLVLGDSLCHTAISPMMLYKDYGITSYLCGSYGQYMYDTLRYLELAFENQTPKIVILETDTLYRKFNIADSIASEIQCAFNIFRYHDRWKDLKIEDLTEDIEYTCVNDYKGYRYKFNINGIPNEPYMIETDEVEEVSELNQLYLAEIVEFCKEKNTELILVSTPSVLNCSYERHNGINELAKLHDLEYIDMNLMTAEVPINWETDTRDKGDHLNHSGAKKVTDYLGKYLAQKNVLDNHREDESYRTWNDSLDIYMEKVEEIYN